MKIIPCIIGLGYVGLPITLNLAKSFVTYGFDKNRKRIENLKNKIDVNREFGPKKFGNIKKNIREATYKFKKEVLSKKYPTKKHSY